MRCKVCGKCRQPKTMCEDCKKIKKSQANMRYRARKYISKSLLKKWGIIK